MWPARPRMWSSSVSHRRRTGPSNVSRGRSLLVGRPVGGGGSTHGCRPQLLVNPLHLGPGSSWRRPIYSTSWSEPVSPRVVRRAAHAALVMRAPFTTAGNSFTLIPRDPLPGAGCAITTPSAAATRYPRSRTSDRLWLQGRRLWSTLPRISLFVHPPARRGIQAHQPGRGPAAVLLVARRCLGRSTTARDRWLLAEIGPADPPASRPIVVVGLRVVDAGWAVPGATPRASTTHLVVPQQLHRVPALVEGRALAARCWSSFRRVCSGVPSAARARNGYEAAIVMHGLVRQHRSATTSERPSPTGCTS